MKKKSENVKIQRLYVLLQETFSETEDKMLVEYLGEKGNFCLRYNNNKTTGTDLN